MATSITRLPGSALVVREACGVYRPRHPEGTACYRIIEDHFEEFALIHEERFEREDGERRRMALVERDRSHTQVSF